MVAHPKERDPRRRRVSSGGKHQTTPKSPQKTSLQLPSSREGKSEKPDEEKNRKANSPPILKPDLQTPTRHPNLVRDPRPLIHVRQRVFPKLNFEDCDLLDGRSSPLFGDEGIFSGSEGRGGGRRECCLVELKLGLGDLGWMGMGRRMGLE